MKLDNFYLRILFLPALVFPIGVAAQMSVAQSSTAGVEVEVDFGAIDSAGDEPSEAIPEESMDAAEVPDAVETAAETEPMTIESSGLEPAESEGVESIQGIETAMEPAPEPAASEPMPEADKVDEVETAASSTDPMAADILKAAPEEAGGASPPVASPVTVADPETVEVDDPLMVDEPIANREIAPSNTAVPQDERGLTEDIRFVSNDLGERLIVRYEIVKENDPTQTLQLRLFDDAQYDPETFSFVPAEVFVISGQGLTVSGLSFNVEQQDKREAMIALLRRFEEDARRFANRRDEIVGREKDWLVEGISGLNGNIPYGMIETDFFKGPADVTFNWDFRSERIWLSLNGLVNIDSVLAFPIRNFLENTDRYVEVRRKYAAQIASTKEIVGSILGE